MFLVEIFPQIFPKLSMSTTTTMRRLTTALSRPLYTSLSGGRKASTGGEVELINLNSLSLLVLSGSETILFRAPTLKQRTLRKEYSGGQREAENSDSGRISNTR